MTAHIYSTAIQDIGSPAIILRNNTELNIACSMLRDSRARGIEKARTRKKKTGGNFSFFTRPAPIFARPTLSRLPNYLRAWNRLSWIGLYNIWQKKQNFEKWVSKIKETQGAYNLRRKSTEITLSITSRVRLWKINHTGRGCSFYEFYEWYIFQ